MPRASSFWFGRTRPRSGGRPRSAIWDAPFSALGRPSPPLRDAPLSCSGTSVSSAPGRPVSRHPPFLALAPGPHSTIWDAPAPFPPRDALRGAPPFPASGGLSLPASGFPPRGSLPTQEAHLSTPAPTWESHLLTAALNLEGTSRIVRKTGQKTRLFVQSGDSGRFPRPSRHVPQFRHCISPVHHCIYSGYI